jgi:hypothetical protein
MATHSNTKDKQMRHRIAMEAARILAEGGLPDYQMAKRKAATRLGAPDTRNLPSNAEIEEALAEHHRLFHSQTQPIRLRQLRRAALEAMRFFDTFQPRLVGSVLSGTANDHSDVQLHLFADTPEEIAWHLMENHIPYKQGERRLRYKKDQYAVYPVYRFLADGVCIDLTVFPIDNLRQPPRSIVDGKTMRRATISAVEALLHEPS